LGSVVIRTGIIGLSEGNGHPFSFSAIVNGYDHRAFAKAGWDVILDYLRLQQIDRFGIEDARVTHAWTQFPEITARLCAATRIENPCADVSEMIGEIDALIIARDDWESHLELAMPFLQRGLPVFIDKPLTLNLSELSVFSQYLEGGQLMSCSGMRFAAEIDSLRVPRPTIGEIRLVSGAVLNGPEKYGIHLIDAVTSLGGAFASPVAITRLEAPHDSFLLHFENGVPFHLDCLGNVGKTFHLSFFGDLGHCQIDLHDNFSAFRRTLEHFFTMVRTGSPVISCLETIRTMQLLSAARSLAPGKTIRLEI
jgi:hypothetical protein